MKIAIAAAALAATSLIAVAAPAAAQNYNASIGYTAVDSAYGDMGAITGRLGWKSGSFWGLEGELGTGVKDVTALGSTFEIDYHAAAYVTGTLPIAPTWDVIGRVGYGTTKISASPGGTATEDSINYGAGLQWTFAGNNALRADYTRHDFRDSTVGKADTWALSYVRKF